MDLTSVRAEIKAWEHEFRSTHARDPTVQEIKDRPEIGITLYPPFISEPYTIRDRSGQVQALQVSIQGSRFCPCGGLVHDASDNAS